MNKLQATTAVALMANGVIGIYLSFTISETFNGGKKMVQFFFFLIMTRLFKLFCCHQKDANVENENSRVNFRTLILTSQREE